MKEKNNKEKLRLNKETIRNLSDESLSTVAGGTGSAVLICSGVCGSNVCFSAVCSVIGCC